MAQPYSEPPNSKQVRTLPGRVGSQRRRNMPVCINCLKITRLRAAASDRACAWKQADADRATQQRPLLVSCPTQAHCPRHATAGSGPCCHFLCARWPARNCWRDGKSTGISRLGLRRGTTSAHRCWNHVHGDCTHPSLNTRRSGPLNSHGYFRTWAVSVKSRTMSKTCEIQRNSRQNILFDHRSGPFIALTPLPFAFLSSKHV